SAQCQGQAGRGQPRTGSGRGDQARTDQLGPEPIAMVETGPDPRADRRRQRVKGMEQKAVSGWEREASGAEIADAEHGTHISEIFFPVLAEWRPVLEQLQVPPDVAFEIAARTQASGEDFASA